MATIVRLEKVHAEPMDDGFVIISESDGEVLKGHMSRNVLLGFCKRTLSMLMDIDRTEQATSMHPHTCPYADRRCEPTPH